LLTLYHTHRQALGISRSRSASPDLVIPSDDEDEDLDPELRQIALKVKASKSPTAGTVEDDSTVKIKVQLIPHPLNKGAQPQAWAFLMKRVRRFFGEWICIHTHNFFLLPE
jgi:hypothetical protein